jgi:hypothetical protein
MKSAPWTDTEVRALEEWQACAWVHPFTCGNDGEVLQPTPAGWHCPRCDWQQTWAHDFMFSGAPPAPFGRFP